MSSSTNLLDISVWKKNRINTFWREGASGVSRLMRTGVDSKFVVGVLFPDFKRALEFSRLWESVTVPLKCNVNVTDYFRLDSYVRIVHTMIAQVFAGS